MTLLALSFVISVSHAVEQPNFDFGELENVGTVCEKAGVVWAIHYGEDKQGHIVYAVFNKGKGPSPVSPSVTLRSDGSRVSALNIQIDGKNISPPDPIMNSMVIVNGKVERGKFRPLTLEGFQRFLQDKTPLSIDTLEKFGKDSVEHSDRTSK